MKETHADIALNYLELLKLIPRDKSITVKQMKALMDRKGIHRDIRSISRALEALRDRFDIERSEIHKPHQYRWRIQPKGFWLPGLTKEEQLVLAMAHRYLSPLFPQRVLDSLSQQFALAMTAYEEKNEEKNGLENHNHPMNWLKKVRIVDTSQTLLPSKIQDSVFQQVSEALYNDHYLRITYKNATKKINNYDIMPLGLVKQGERLYLVCQFRGYKNQRILAINRIVKAQVLSETFQYPENFNLEKYDAEGHFGMGHGNKVRLSFFIRQDVGEHLVESPLSLDQTVAFIPDQHAYHIEATLVETQHLQRWLRGWTSDEMWNIKLQPISDNVDKLSK